METIEKDVGLIVQAHKEQNKYNPQIDNIEEMNAHFLQCYPREGCGVVVNSKFIAHDNVYDEDQLHNFRIRRGDLFQYNKGKDVQALMHSHTHQDSTFDISTPTKSDMEAQKAMNIPWGIVSTEGEHVTAPLWFGLEVPVALEGRKYIPNVQDCLNLCCDYMKLEFNIDLPIFPREVEWQTENKNMITDGIDVSGFKRLSRSTPLDQLQHGDWILFAIQSSYVNHCGIVTQDGMFYHQLQGRFSKKDHIAKWDRQIKMYLRHKDLE